MLGEKKQLLRCLACIFLVLRARCSFFASENRWRGLPERSRVAAAGEAGSLALGREARRAETSQ